MIDNQDRFILNDKSRNLNSNQSKFIEEQTFNLNSKFNKSQNTGNLSILALTQNDYQSPKKVNKMVNFCVKKEHSAFDDLITDHNQINKNQKLLKLELLFRSQREIPNNKNSIFAEFEKNLDGKDHKQTNENRKKNISTPVSSMNFQSPSGKKKIKLNNGVNIFNNSSRHNNLKNDLNKLPAKIYQTVKNLNSETSKNKNVFPTCSLNTETNFQGQIESENFKVHNNKNNTQAYKANNLQISKKHKIMKISESPISKINHDQYFRSSNLINSNSTEKSNYFTIKPYTVERKKNLTADEFKLVVDRKEVKNCKDDNRVETSTNNQCHKPSNIVLQNSPLPENIYGTFFY